MSERGRQRKRKLAREGVKAQEAKRKGGGKGVSKVGRERAIERASEQRIKPTSEGSMGRAAGVRGGPREGLSEEGIARGR